jgi:ribonucleoside-diphosphate reductase alpha chain
VTGAFAIARGGSGAVAFAAGGAATAFRRDVEQDASPAPVPGATLPQGEPDFATRVAHARMKGYEGEACSECGNFTMVRNGTCLKCDTCGGTSGCS